MLVFKSDSDSLLYTDLHQRIKRLPNFFQRSGTGNRLAITHRESVGYDLVYNGPVFWFFRMRINPSSGEVRFGFSAFFHRINARP